MKKWLQLFTVFLLSFLLISCETAQDTTTEDIGGILLQEADQEELYSEDGNIPYDADGGTSRDTEQDQDANNNAAGADTAAEGQSDTLSEDAVCSSRDEVAQYLHLYGHLPSNYITKDEANALGWEGGSLEPYAPGKCIGGNRFGNYEGLLPQKDGRFYTECDIDTLGADKRGAKRIVFSNDGLIYYTEDHYESFELLYGGEQL